jgi:hypothetical protein
VAIFDSYNVSLCSPTRLLVTLHAVTDGEIALAGTLNGQTGEHLILPSTLIPRMEHVLTYPQSAFTDYIFSFYKMSMTVSAYTVDYRTAFGATSETMPPYKDFAPSAITMRMHPPRTPSPRLSRPPSSVNLRNDDQTLPTQQPMQDVPGVRYLDDGDFRYIAPGYDWPSGRPGDFERPARCKGPPGPGAR